MSQRFRRRSRDSNGTASSRQYAVSTVVVIAGVAYLMLGMAQLLQPDWYFENLFNAPPFNEIVIGQLGGVTLPLGVVLVIASQRPLSNRLVIGAGAASAVLWFLVQLYAVANNINPGGLVGLGTLGLFALALVWAFWQIRPQLRS